MERGLEAIFAAQKELCDRYGVPVNLVQQMRSASTDAERESIKKELEEWHCKLAQALIMESSELLDWAPWKHWSKKSGNKLVAEKDLYGEEHLTEIKVEIIDIIHFVIEFALLLGMTHEDIEKGYFSKNEINHERKSNPDY